MLGACGVMVSSLKGGRAVEIIGGCCRPPYAALSGGSGGQNGRSDRRTRPGSGLDWSSQVEIMGALGMGTAVGLRVQVQRG